jgi:hypothetical protein
LFLCVCVCVSRCVCVCVSPVLSRRIRIRQEVWIALCVPRVSSTYMVCVCVCLVYVCVCFTVCVCVSCLCVCVCVSRCVCVFEHCAIGTYQDKAESLNCTFCPSGSSTYTVCVCVCLSVYLSVCLSVTHSTHIIVSPRLLPSLPHACSILHAAASSSKKTTIKL